MVGWILKIEVVTSFVPGLPTMKFNTALGFILSGAALFFTQQKGIRIRTYVVNTISAILVLMGCIELSEYIFNYVSGIDQLFVQDTFNLSGGVPGRMAAGTALCFSLCGIALWGSRNKHPRVQIAAQYCLHVVSLIATTAFLGYLFQVPTFYKFLMLNSMALHTAITFFLFSIAAAFARPDLGLAELFMGKYTGNIMARKIFPRILLGIILLAFLRIAFNWAYPGLDNVGIALFGMGVIIIGLFIVWHTSLVLNNSDKKRVEAEEALSALNKDLEKTVGKRTADLNASIEKLKQSEDSFKLLVEGVTDYAIYMIDPTGRIMGWNKGAQNIKGYSPEEVIGKSISLFYSPEDVARNEHEYGLEVSRERGHYETEGWRVRKDGSKFWANIVLTPLYDQGILRGYSKITRDITGKKNAEEMRTREALLMQTLPDALVYGDKKDFKITNLNKAAEELFGISAAQARGKRVAEIVSYQMVGVHPEEVRKELWEKSGRWRGEMLFTTMDGRHLNVLATVKTMQDYTGQDTGWFAIYSDITALKTTEGRLELAFEGTSAGLWDWDIKKDKRWWSPRYFELLGYEFNELTPSREALLDLIHPDDAAMFFTTLQRNFSLPGRFEMEARYKTKCGEYKWFQAIGKTKFGENGEPLRMVGSILDIDEKKKAHHIINQQAELIKMLPDGIIYGDMNNNIVGLNKGAEDMFEITAEEACGRNLEDIVSLKVVGSRESNKNELMQKGVMRYEGELTNSSGKKFALLATVKLITDIDTQKPGWVCIYTDITPLRLNEELKEALRKLEANNGYLEQLAYISAHDIKAPIIALEGLTNVLLKSEALKHEHSEIMRMIANKIQQMHLTNQSLNNILKLRKSLLTAVHEDKKTATLQEIVNGVLQSLQSEMDQANSKVEINLGNVAQIGFPAEHLKSIFYNLIANAVKYRDPNRPLIVRVKAREQENNRFLLVVEDNGLGFDLSQHKDKLYGIFKRFHNHVNGAGVGLHTVKSIADAYGGTIEVESAVGKGTSFKIIFKQGVI